MSVNRNQLNSICYIFMIGLQIVTKFTELLNIFKSNDTFIRVFHSYRGNLFISHSNTIVYSGLDISKLLAANKFNALNLTAFDSTTSLTLLLANVAASLK